MRRAKKRFSRHDALYVWQKPKRRSALLEAPAWKALPAALTVRVLRVRIAAPGRRTRNFLLVTSLLDPVAVPAAELLEAYGRRWRLELCLRDVKSTLGLEKLRCQSPAMVEKELLVFLSAYNLVRWLMAQAAVQERVALERLSFQGTLDGFRQWSQALACTPRESPQRQRLWTLFLRQVARDQLPIRPGRHESRAIKRRSKYPPLTRPRGQYRERPLAQTRRRKAKVKKKARTS